MTASRPQEKIPKKPPTETDIQSSITHYLKIEPRVKLFLRINSGRAYVKGFMVRFYSLFMHGQERKSDSVSDIVGMLRNGKFFSLEVKKPGETPTEGQSDFLEAVRQSNGIAGVVYCWQDAKALIDLGMPMEVTPCCG
jgi:hypothetical protein